MLVQKIPEPVLLVTTGTASEPTEIVSGAELPVHPFASVTVTVKVPVDVTSIVEVNLLFDQE
jgi:hypothetical protein